MASLKNETVLYDVVDSVATIKMNRPHVKNAINLEMHEELYACFVEAERDSAVKVIVLTGSDEAFSSGADIKSIPINEMASFDHGDYLAKTYNRLVLFIDEMTKPTVAHIRGTAVGAGLSLALACDYRVAEDDAKLALSFFGIGLVPDAGASYFLPRLVGLGKAMEISLGGSLSVKDALQVGLINQMGAVTTLVEGLKLAPQPAYGWMKKNMKAGGHLPLNDVLELEVEGQRIAGKSNAHLQSVMAFLKK